MSVRNTMWTALPNGFTLKSDRLRLSVLVTPRLETASGARGKLGEFPDFLDWPAFVSKLNFQVEFPNGPA